MPFYSSENCWMPILQRQAACFKDFTMNQDGSILQKMFFVMSKRMFLPLYETLVEIAVIALLKVR